MIRLVVLLLLAVGGWLAMPSEAKAAECSSVSVGCDQGAAYSACYAAGANAMTQLPDLRRNPDCIPKTSGSNKYYQCVFDTRPSKTAEWQIQAGGCGNFWYGGLCSSRELAPGGSGALFVGTATATGVCSNGCWYASTSTTTSTKLGGAGRVISSKGLTPDGSTCAVASPVAQNEQCLQDGTLTQCVKSDGSHCAQASNGTQFCWKNNEAGVKVAPNGNEAATKSPEGAGINAPRTPPKNGGDWQVVGQSSTGITNNNTTNNYNTTNYQSTYGPSGSGGSSGGSGGDGGSGDGGDDGGDDGGNDPGGVGSGVGDLYTPSGLSMQGILGPYYQQVMAVPIVAGLTHFMGVQGGGSCPVFTVEATQYWSAMSFSAHCSGEILGYLRACGWVIFAMAAYIAVRIAVT